MVNGITNTSSLQMINALQAFKKSNINSLQKNNTQEPENTVDMADENHNIDNTYSFIGNKTKSEPQQSVQSAQFINDVKNFAIKNGNVVDDNDIQYAMRYGRSILVDTKA